MIDGAEMGLGPISDAGLLRLFVDQRLLPTEGIFLEIARALLLLSGALVSIITTALSNSYFTN
jgi:hypothetical protein